MRTPRNMSVTIFLVVALALPLAAQKPRTIKPGWNLFSVEQDIQLGREAAAEIEKQVQLIDNPDLNRFVARMAGKLTATPEAGKYPYTFKMVNDPAINAFALPGGPVYLNTGLIANADNEAQVAGVVAHEIAHVALRHGTSQVTKAQGLQILAMLGGAVAGGGMMGQLAQLGVGLGANSLLLKYSRGAETDADLLGARMMAQAGYDPVEMARFFQKLEEAGGGRGMPQFLSSHPSPGNRVKAVSQEVRLLPARQYTLGDAAEFERMKQIVKGLPPPPKQPANQAIGNPETARPASQFKRHASSGISFDYPANWEVFQSQGASEITVARRDGILLTNGNAEIGYGAVIGLSQTRSSGSLERDTEAFVQQLMRNNREMQRSQERTQSLTVAGLPALLNLLFNKSPYPNQREVDAVLTIQHPQGLAYMILISPESEYPRAQPAFEQMIRSLRFGR